MSAIPFDDEPKLTTPPIAIVCDTHMGARNDNPILGYHMYKFWKELFFPVLDKYGVKQILHLGDLVDRRKYVNYRTLAFMYRDILQPCEDRNIDFTWILGNHDTFFKNTNKLNASQAVRSKVVSLVETPEERTYNGVPVCLIPWVCDETKQTSIDLLTTTQARYCFGHLELQGFLMHQGLPPSTSGSLDRELFSKFLTVASGHYHHMSTQDNIRYLGAPYEMTWADYDDARGFHLWQPETNDWIYIQNPHTVFRKIVYDDEGQPFAYAQQLIDVLNQQAKNFEHTYVKLHVKTKTQPAWYDIVVDTLYKIGIHDLTVIDESVLDTSVFTTQTGETALTTDTLTLMHQYVNDVSGIAAERRQQVLTLVSDLYKTVLQQSSVTA